MGVELLEARRLFAANLLLDAVGISAAESVNINGTSYFFADNGDTGKELWKSDGTVAGTIGVKDITPGPAGTEVVGIFHGAGNRAVFITITHRPQIHGDPADDYTLWTSDGTAEGTVAQQQFTQVYNLVAKQLGDRVILGVSTFASILSNSDIDTTLDDEHLWTTDGTAANTREIYFWKSDPGIQGEVVYQTYGTTAFFEADRRLVFDTGFGSELWSTDGTPQGTFDMSSALGDVNIEFEAQLDHMIELDHRVLILSKSLPPRFWITDGTIGGTVEHDPDFPGNIDAWQATSTITNGKFILVERDPNPTITTTTVHAVDLSTGGIQALTEPEAGHFIQLLQAGDRVLIVDEDTDAVSATLLGTDGTPQGTVALGSYSRSLLTFPTVNVGGSVFFVVGGLSSDTDANGDSIGLSSRTLWRSDGTPEGTGIVKTLWEGDPRVEASDVTLAAADGDDKLIIHTLVQTGLDENRNPKPDATTVYDDTSVYDPQELSIGRQTATAHLEGGILRISGTLGDDRIRLWRSQRMPGRLVVEYNGNERSFPFSSIRQINVDLQDGNDYFEILEGEGQIIRTKTSILGGDGSDTIYGATGHDTIYGGNSGDRIYGRGNDDVILGGGGRDRINAGAGADEVSGGSGVDSIVGGSGVDVYFGQTAVERIFGENVEGTERDDDVFLG